MLSYDSSCYCFILINLGFKNMILLDYECVTWSLTYKKMSVVVTCVSWSSDFASQLQDHMICYHHSIETGLSGLVVKSADS